MVFLFRDSLILILMAIWIRSGNEDGNLFYYKNQGRQVVLIGL
jgi:hypothetical protein